MIKTMKINYSFEGPLNALKASTTKQMQKCFNLRHDLLSQLYTQFHDVKQALIDQDEMINFEWNHDKSDDTQSFVVKLPLSSMTKSDKMPKGIVLSCPYIRFTAFSMNFDIENPTKFMESLRIGNFMSLKENVENHSLMIHLFEANPLNLEHLIVLRLSLQQLIGMKCGSQNLHFYDGLAQKEINNYLIDSTKEDNNDQYDGLFKYFNKFITEFEAQLKHNVTLNDCYDV